MADNISTLLGLGLGPQDDMEALARSLRNEQSYGDFYGGSSIKETADYGKRLSDRQTQAAQRGGVLRQAMEREATRKAELEAMNQRGLTAEGVRVGERDEDYSRKQADSTLAHERRMELKKLANEQKLVVDKAKSDAALIKDKKKLRPTGKATEDYLRSKQLVEQISGVQGIESGFTADQLEMVDNPVIDTVTDLFLPDGAERLLQDSVIYTDPTVKKYRENVADIESEFSKLMSGLAVSGFEMKDRKKWSPYAEGVSQATRSRRLQNLNDKLGIQIGLKEQTYDFGEGGGISDGGITTEETINVTEGERNGRPNFEEEKSVGGKTYGRIGDRWFEL